MHLRKAICNDCCHRCRHNTRYTQYSNTQLMQMRLRSKVNYCAPMSGVNMHSELVMGYRRGQVRFSK